MTAVPPKELKDLLKSFQEALEYWNTTLLESKGLGDIKSAQVVSPLEELAKLSKLIKAHTTKVGIIFKPETLQKQPEASISTLQRLSESVVFLVSIVGQLEPANLSQIFYDELIDAIKEVIASNSQLAAELIAIQERITESDAQHTDRTDGRLLSVAKVWASCDALLQVVNDGKLGVLNHKFKQSIGFIEDGLDEFEEWTEDPEQCDDPFGFSDDESDSESSPIPEENKQELIDFSKLWLSRFKLIKLLFTSISKSLPSVTSGVTIDTIYESQKNIVQNIDKLIVELMMNARLGEETLVYAREISAKCQTLLSIVKDVNKSSESKVKWCETWEQKWGR